MCVAFTTIILFVSLSVFFFFYFFHSFFFFTFELWLFVTLVVVFRNLIRVRSVFFYFFFLFFFSMFASTRSSLHFSYPNNIPFVSIFAPNFVVSTALHHIHQYNFPFFFILFFFIFFIFSFLHLCLYRSSFLIFFPAFQV